MSKHTQTKPAKPAKPYADFPLFPHATGRWAKKIKGKFVYFGPWADPDAALAKYQLQRDDLYAGRVPRNTAEGLTVRDLLNHFLTAKKRQVEADELKLKTFGDYHACCGRLVEAFGKSRLVDDLRAEDFGRFRAELAKVRGPVALGNEIQRVRTVFKFGYDAGLIDKPVRFGPEFKKPSAKTMRLARQANGNRMIEAANIRRLMDAASTQLRAMVLLAMNCGLGNTDVSELPMSAVDLDAAMLDYPRPKTGIQRRCPLWPETMQAVRQVIEQRRDPIDKADADLLFITTHGRRWVRTRPNRVSVDSVGLEFGKLLRRLDLKRHGLNFYALRHVHRTIADETRDFPAIDRIMGHEETASMATRYRERISDDRLRAVVGHVRKWLYDSNGHAD